jgi:hypothetical protein
MAGSVFTTGATLQCGHGATAAPLSSARKLTVSGKPVITEDELLTANFPGGCSQTKTNSGEKPCLKIASVTGAKAGKLTVNGAPVIVAPLGGATDGAPKNTDLSGSAGQAKLTAS